MIAWDHFSPYEIRSELAELGLTVTPTADGLMAEPNSRLTAECFLSIGRLLVKLPPLQSLNLSYSDINNLEPLKGLTTLKIHR